MNGGGIEILEVESNWAETGGQIEHQNCRRSNRTPKLQKVNQSSEAQHD